MYLVFTISRYRIQIHCRLPTSVLKQFAHRDSLQRYSSVSLHLIYEKEIGRKSSLRRDRVASTIPYKMKKHCSRTKFEDIGELTCREFEKTWELEEWWSVLGKSTRVRLPIEESAGRRTLVASRPSRLYEVQWTSSCLDQLSLWSDVEKSVDIHYTCYERRALSLSSGELFNRSRLEFLLLIPTGTHRPLLFSASNKLCKKAFFFPRTL